MDAPGRKARQERPRTTSEEPPSLLRPASRGLTLLHAHRRRGREAVNDFAVLSGYTEIAVHDAWAP